MPVTPPHTPAASSDEPSPLTPLRLALHSLEDKQQLSALMPDTRDAASPTTYTSLPPTTEPPASQPHPQHAAHHPLPHRPAPSRVDTVPPEPPDRGAHTLATTPALATQPPENNNNDTEKQCRGARHSPAHKNNAFSLAAHPATAALTESTRRQAEDTSHRPPSVGGPQRGGSQRGTEDHGRAATEASVYHSGGSEHQLPSPAATTDTTHDPGIRR